MKKLNLIFLVSVCFSIIGIVSCKKQEGFGGRSAITGKVILNHYNNDFSLLKSSEPAIDEYVYLVFGNQSGYGTRVKTSYDGSFEFTNLSKGSYKVYCYSMDNTQSNSNGYIPVINDVSITKKKEILTTDNIVISDNKAIGYGKITGKVKEVDTQNNAQYYIGEQRVYITYDNDVNYFTSIKTNANGTYQFSNLPVGHYTVYTYSKDINNSYPGPTYAVSTQTDILSINQSTNLLDLVIYK